jgi:uncharacterized protein YjbJ (UPF0337 family)
VSRLADAATPPIRGALALHQKRRFNMSSSTKDKVKGHADEAIGKAKQGVGKAIDSDKLRAKGVVQEAKGKAEKAIGHAKDAIKKAVDK